MNMAKLMKQAQKMQADMQRLQEEFAQKTYQATAGGGAVTATVTGGGDLQSLKISPDLLKEGDAELLQDMIVTAVNEAHTKSKADLQKTMSGMTGGMGLPF